MILILRSLKEIRILLDYLVFQCGHLVPKMNFAVTVDSVSTPGGDVTWSLTAKMGLMSLNVV